MREYELMMRRAEKCREAASRTVSDPTMQSVWEKAALSLEKKARAMSIARAERFVVYNFKGRRSI